MGLLSGLKNLGLGTMEEVNIIEDKKAAHKSETPVPEKTPEELEQEAVFERVITCPVCDLEFKTKSIRPGKAKLSGSDTDLRPRYEKIDPIKYDAIACSNCGYAGLTKYFPSLSSRQLKAVKEQIAANFKGFDTHPGIYTYDDAIMRYKLALVTTVVKQAKNSERAYTALKLAWVLRGKREQLEKEGKGGDAIEELKKDETEALTVAYDGFTIALSKETAPLANMDENTVMYLLAELAHRLKKYEDAYKLCGMVLVSKSTQSRLKERAYDLKEALKEEIKQEQKTAG